MPDVSAWIARRCRWNYLSLGMAVEVKVVQRRMIEFLLSPLLKSMSESLRER